MIRMLAICAALLAASPAKAAHWGLDAGGHFWTIDGAELDRQAATVNSFGGSRSLEKGRAAFFPSLFVEGKGTLRLGASFGYGMMPEASLKSSFFDGSANHQRRDLRLRTNHMALDIYLKLSSKDGRGGLLAGAGVNNIRSEAVFVRDTNNSSLTSDTYVQRLLVPHVRAGAEISPLNWLTLYAGAKYLFGGVFDDYKYHGETLTMAAGPGGEWISSAAGALAANERPFEVDYSGLRLMAGLRVYFR